jgi:exopolysaccharide production protein ExoZ
MLSNLQVLRGVAALGVVFFHTGYKLAGDWHTEFFGVSTFFVISGFIMCFITQKGADDFLAKRLVRIAPLYWLCTLVILVVMFGFALFDSATWRSPLDGRPGEPLWAYVGRSLLFLPIGDKYPILNVGWSLNYEMYFYLIFAAALAISRRLAPLIVVGCLVALNHAADTVCTAAACHYLSLDYTKFFIAGIAIFYALQTFAPAAPRRTVVWIGVALIALCYGSQFVGPLWANSITPSIYMTLAAAAPVVIVASALFVEYAGGAITWRPLILIGDASYAIYLTHPIVFEIMKTSNERWLQLPTPESSTTMMLFYVALAGVAGVIVHLAIENPLLRLIRRKRQPGTQTFASGNGLDAAGPHQAASAAR